MGCGNFLPLAQLQSVYPSLLITQCAKNTASQWQQVLTTNWVNDAGGLPVTLWTHTGPALCLSVYHLISALCPCYPAAGLMESNIRAWLQGRNSANSFQGCGHICLFCFGFFLAHTVTCQDSKYALRNGFVEPHIPVDTIVFTVTRCQRK